MEKDMRYYVQITGDRMLDNIEKSHELTEELIKEYELFREKSNNSDNSLLTTLSFMYSNSEDSHSILMTFI